MKETHRRLHLLTACVPCGLKNKDGKGWDTEGPAGASLGCPHGLQAGATLLPRARHTGGPGPTPPELTEREDLDIEAGSGRWRQPRREAWGRPPPTPDSL